MIAVRRDDPGPAAAAPAGRPRRYPDFARLLGPAAWSRLPAAVRARFPSVHGGNTTVCYTGTMRCVRASLAGRLLAVIAKVFDTPVATRTGDNVLTVVRVYPAPAVKGIVWERIYHFAGHAPVTVRSTKCLDGAGRLIESLGFGLRMKLELTERNGTLRFTSTGYYIELPWGELPLPCWLPPGTTHVIHTDEGAGRFRFTLYTEHAWFGRMFFQEGIFAATEAGS